MSSLSIHFPWSALLPLSLSPLGLGPRLLHFLFLVLWLTAKKCVCPSAVLGLIFLAMTLNFAACSFSVCFLLYWKVSYTLFQLCLNIRIFASLCRLVFALHAACASERQGSLIFSLFPVVIHGFMHKGWHISQLKHCCYSYNSFILNWAAFGG